MKFKTRVPLVKAAMPAITLPERISKDITRTYKVKTLRIGRLK